MIRCRARYRTTSSIRANAFRSSSREQISTTETRLAVRKNGIASSTARRASRVSFQATTTCSARNEATPGATSSAGRPSLTRTSPGSRVRCLAALSLLPYDDEIGAAGFARQCVARQIQRRSPFDVLTIRADDVAEPVSSLRQRLVHFLYVSFRSHRCDHTFVNERRRNGTGRETYQRCIKLRGKLRGNSNPLFRNTIDVDIDHQGCIRHEAAPQKNLKLLCFAATAIDASQI